MKINISKAASFVAAGAIEALEPQVKAAQEALEQGTCPGNDFLGWLHLPSSITPEFIAETNETAKVLKENCEAVVVAGIGGSYLGARMVIDALSNSFGWLQPSDAPRILFAGNEAFPHSHYARRPPRERFGLFGRFARYDVLELLSQPCVWHYDRTGV